MTIAPYGSWVSPISAADVAQGSHPVQSGRYVGDDIWWSELRGSEGGRYGVFRANPDGGEPIAVLPAPWNARSRVHEYGGGAWTATDDGALVFVQFGDQRVHLLRAGAEPTPLTPGGEHFSFGELSVRGDEVIAIRELEDGKRVARDIVAIPLDGTAADDPARIRTLASGSDFVVAPRFSPDGTHLAWIAWDHPQMPWDGTELRVAPIAADGTIGEPRTLLGGPDESVLQPEWRDDATLTAITDASGFWNLATVSLDGTSSPLLTQERDTGGPLWNVGTTWYAPLESGTGSGRVLLQSTFGSDRLELLDLGTGVAVELDVPFTSILLADRRGSRLLFDGGAAGIAGGMRELDLDTGALRDIRLDVDALPDEAYLPLAEERTFAGAREVHAIVYPPRNPDYTAPDGELPPYIAFVHGGPTAHTQASLNLVFAYYTSRGIGVVDVNYGGSTGYGREYRNRLRGQWGIVDVEDVITVVQGLAAEGSADPKRLGIEGGSAGGWTVLAALTGSDVFSAGVSLYGVADLTALAEFTHDFESRYTDGLVGPLPEAQAIYDERSPLNHIDRLSTPVLLLQGLDDPVVPPAQSERFRDGLLAKGIPHAYVAFEGESHGFRKTETRIRAREASLSFYGQVLGFEVPGVPELELWRPAVSNSTTAPQN
ncbi:S9 family peptidase [Naasia lichenicola]|uniref:S9 family peptidase n=1 Tax=Naasia lichenicola TaxID=2565933 RepID=A0A4S4FT12_9MICO|nr:prolyl oligopeptidase family serine peptidase [Naasia lichenicola]THG32875.1 S9 family peptidase [Naasia lichenicola]